MRKYPKMLLLVAIMSVVGAGCGQKAAAQSNLLDILDTELMGEDASIPEGSPLNTLSECELWGDDSDFLKITELKAGVIHKEDFSSGGIEIKAGKSYAAIVHYHNTSGKALQDVGILLIHPKLITPSENALVAIVYYDGNVGDAFSANLTLDTERTLELVPNAEDRIKAVDLNGGEAKFSATGLAMEENDVAIIQMSKLPADANYNFVYMFSVAEP